MPVDTSIYQNYLRPIKSVQEYDQEAQQAEGNKLGLLLQRGQYDAQQRRVAEDASFRNLLSSGADEKALMAASPTKALALMEGRAKIGKENAQTGLYGAQTKQADANAGKTNWEAREAKRKTALTDIAALDSPETAIRSLQAHFQAGDLDEQKYQSVLATIPQNPADFPAWQVKMLRSIMSAENQMLGERKRTDQAETARNNKAQNGIAILGQDITMRGQNMTDSRARDFNAVQVEANNIKRSEKKDVADLTKNSQVASFDTMLGTLDRLGKHSGLSRSVGVTGAFPTMPGSDSANFQAELNTFQSQAFLPMVAQLKGMGALSDAEGKKLTAAVGALDPKMGEQAFRDSVARIAADMEAARTRVAGAPRAGGASGEWGSPASRAPKAGAVDGGYRFKGGNPADKSNWEKVQ